MRGSFDSNCGFGRETLPINMNWSKRVRHRQLYVEHAEPSEAQLVKRISITQLAIFLELVNKYDMYAPSAMARAMKRTFIMLCVRVCKHLVTATLCYYYWLDRRFILCVLKPARCFSGDARLTAKQLLYVHTRLIVLWRSKFDLWWSYTRLYSCVAIQCSEFAMGRDRMAPKIQCEFLDYRARLCLVLIAFEVVLKRHLEPWEPFCRYNL